MKTPPKSLPGEVTLELGLDDARDTPALRQRIARELGVEEEMLPAVVLRKRSLDCRRGRVRYHMLFELGAGSEAGALGFGVADEAELGAPHPVEVSGVEKVVI